MQAFPQGEPGSPTVAGAPEVLTVPPAANTEPTCRRYGAGGTAGGRDGGAQKSECCVSTASRESVQGAPSGSSPRQLPHPRPSRIHMPPSCGDRTSVLSAPPLSLHVFPEDTTHLTAGCLSSYLILVLRPQGSLSPVATDTPEG